jgi:hypothetical protein
VLLYIVTRDAIAVLVQTPTGGLDAVNLVLDQVMYRVAIFTVFAYAAISAADFAFQKWQHTKGLMMTKDEVKREYKEMEGDPHIKSKRKQLAQELIMNDSTANVRKATVLITNPTHKAIAVYYKQGETKLPIVTAKGEGYLAQRMIEVAKEEGAHYAERPAGPRTVRQRPAGTLHPQRAHRAHRRGSPLGPAADPGQSAWMRKTLNDNERRGSSPPSMRRPFEPAFDHGFTPVRANDPTPAHSPAAPALPHSTLQPGFPGTRSPVRTPRRPPLSSAFPSAPPPSRREGVFCAE